VQEKSVILSKNLAHGEAPMIKEPNNKDQISFFTNFFACNRQLDPDNRWIVLSKLIPWEEIEEKYKKLFSGIGAPGKAIRVAVGSLIIKERMGFTDDQTRDYITENPYAQYFLGYDQYTTLPPFDQSSMTRFRKRFTAEIMQDINEMICQSDKAKALIKRNDDDDTPTLPGSCGDESNKESTSSENKGTLIIDATCVPADIHYPTDVTLLNDARELTERIIDELHKPLTGQEKKPRSYRQKARKQFLSFIKKKRPGPVVIRKAIRQQLGYVGRNLRHIGKLAEISDLGLLPRALYKKLLVINELYRQQRYMYVNKIHKVEDRIVSIHQPHVRPIVRGKANADVEFGAKISISVVDGMTYLETMSFDNYSESKYLEHTVMAYKKRFGCLPDTILVDQIYRNRENRRFCKMHGIRINGPRLGRPPAESTPEERLENRIDEGMRNQVEGKFGEGKRRFGLERLLTRLPETSGCLIAVNCIVMNLEHLLRNFLFSFFKARIFRLSNGYQIGLCVVVA
jgi:IS5 family transposase